MSGILSNTDHGGLHHSDQRPLPVLEREQLALAARHALGPRHSLPAIKNGERIASGKEQLMVYLKELEGLAREWRAFQGDWCYVDDQGEVC